MRFSKPTMILSLATTLTWFGWLAVPPDAAAQGMCQIPENCAAECQGPGMDQEQCQEPAACDIPSECDQCGPRWTFTAEAIALQRTTARNQPLFTGVQTLDSDPLYARDLNFPVALGYQVSAIRRDVCGCDWEVAYFQVDGFSSEATLPGTSLMVTDVNGTGFVLNNAAARYNSAIYSGEVNVRRQCSDWFTFLAGFRMAQLNEQYLAGGPGSLFPSVSYSLATNTYNHLYGFQLGADIGVYDMGGPLQINVLCKAGVYDNFAHESYNQMIVNNNGTIVTNINSGAGRNQAAFLGEAGAVATYALTKRLAFRASAEAMWITGVALAPEQISAVNLRTNKFSINTSGGVFYYGGGLGLEYRF